MFHEIVRPRFSAHADVAEAESAALANSSIRLIVLGDTQSPERAHLPSQQRFVGRLVGPRSTSRSRPCYCSHEPHDRHRYAPGRLQSEGSGALDDVNKNVRNYERTHGCDQKAQAGRDHRNSTPEVERPLSRNDSALSRSAIRILVYEAFEATGRKLEVRPPNSAWSYSSGTFFSDTQPDRWRRPAGIRLPRLAAGEHSADP